MYQIDQSGKVEQTNKLTVVAIANGESFSVRIKASEKRILKQAYREQNRPDIFRIQVFAILVYILLERAQLGDMDIVIDREYLGHEDIIKSYIIQLGQKCQKIHLLRENIEFGFIGKRSSAHAVAHAAFLNNQSTFLASCNEILELATFLDH